MRIDANLSPPPLPPNVTIQDVYADFLDFIFSHTRRYLDETTGSGSLGSLWTRFESTFALVLTVPNGWDSSQQSLLRDAVVAANILPDDFHPSRLAFVSEAESSVHFAISHAQIGSWLRRGTTFAVCDAGGSTVDTVVYRCTSAAPTLMLEEVTASECVQAGGAVVDQHAEAMVKKKMAGSKFDDPETISTIVSEFEVKAVGFCVVCKAFYTEPSHHRNASSTAATTLASWPQGRTSRTAQGTSRRGASS